VIGTDGSSGIGRASALRFAELGANALITGRRAAFLDKTAGVHANIETLVADTGDPEDAPRAVASAVQRWEGWTYLSTILKQAAASELIMAIREVQEGRFFLSPSGSRDSRDRRWSEYRMHKTTYVKAVTDTPKSLGACCPVGRNTLGRVRCSRRATAPLQRRHSADIL
jgi:NAD(P)-dependent dehydrogenase (short-subunit alcohol dehydrogenase family)